MREPASAYERISPFGWVSLIALASALLALPRTGHVDDSDAAVYQVVVRNMVADRSWFELRYLPRVHPHFHEHLPFAFWPAAAAVRVFGEHAISIVGGLESLLMLVCVAWLAQRIAGGIAGAVAFVSLAATESIFVLGPTARLDPLLLLLTMLSVAPFLAPRMVRRSIWLGIGCAALATLVKGPFGLLPWCCASAARAICDRLWAPLRWGIAGALLGALPVAAFLAADRLFGHGAWWEGYGRAQLLASAVGARTDGLWPFWYPLYVVAGRLWPGLPLALLGIALAIRSVRRPKPEDLPLQLLAMTSGLVLLGLMVPARKAWNHSLIVFPLLAMLGGVAVRRALRANPFRALRLVQSSVAALFVAVLVATAFGAGRLWTPRCVAAGPLHPRLALLAAGTPVAVVSGPPSWLTVGSLAAELRLSPAPVATLAEVSVDYSWAVVEEGHWAPTPAWRLVNSGGGWALVERQ